jgi:protein-disulfide isomerase
MNSFPGESDRYSKEEARSQETEIGMRIAAFLLACTFAIGQPKTPQKSALDKATLEVYLRTVELFLPQVTAKIDDAKPSTDLPGFFDVWIHWSANGATKDELVYISKDGTKLVRGDAFDVNKNPFQSNLDKLKTDLQPSFGAAGAPVVMVVFSDFQCPVCKEEAQVLRQNLAKTFPDKVRVYFKDFPLDSIHNWARQAAIAGRCVFKQSPAKFWDYFDWAYENQQTIGADNFSTKLQAFATEKALDGMQLGRCMDNKATDAEISREVDEGRSLQVSATPTIFLNGRKLEGALPWPTIEQLVNLEIEHQATAHDAGEKCCEVSLPKIVK